MSRRARAAVFLFLALLCAAAAAALASGYRASVAQSFGPLRKVVVARNGLAAGQPIGPADISRALQVRRVPARFVPSGAIALPDQALGREPAAPIPAGSYVLAAQLREQSADRRPTSRSLAAGRRPVEITVSGGEALLALGGSPGGARVDVVVTTEPTGTGPGRTYMAASAVRLLELTRQAPEGPGPSPGWSATLALTRGQALRLIEAESFARSVRLLPLPNGLPTG
jgi:Flp pilus assembly protein CpaB